MSKAATRPSDEFAAAHRRHWQDAEVLFGLGMLGNADHLYGFSAECGLKAVITEWGLMGREHRKHVQFLWPEFVALAEGRGGQRYLRLLPGGTPFEDWSHHARYTETGFTSKAKVQSHRKATRDVLAMVQASEGSL